MPTWAKLYAFYMAPITTFWAYTLSYGLFLIVFSYMCLVRTPAKPTWAEVYVVLYITNVAVKHVRRMITSEPKTLAQKLKVFFHDYWNNVTTLAVVTFFIGFLIRISGLVQHGRVIYAVNTVFWYTKCLCILSVHNRLGPYITMMAKMVVNMIYIITITLIVLIPFGVVKQSITYPYEQWSWMLVRNVFYKPYFMLYGEVFPEDIAPCGDRGELCVTGQWVVPALMAVFLLVANILLVNLLIAVFKFAAITCFIKVIQQHLPGNGCRLASGVEVSALRSGDGVRVDALSAAAVHHPLPLVHAV